MKENKLVELVSLTSLADTVNCAYNDMKHIHFHVIGEKFDIVHSIAEEYYEELADLYDAIAEKALELKETVNNPAYSAQNTDWTFIQENEIEADDCFTAMYVILTKVILALEDVKNVYAGILDSFIDEKLDYWNKEVYYKLDARMKDD